MRVALEVQEAQDLEAGTSRFGFEPSLPDVATQDLSNLDIGEVGHVQRDFRILDAIGHRRPRGVPSTSSTRAEASRTINAIPLFANEVGGRASEPPRRCGTEPLQHFLAAWPVESLAQLAQDVVGHGQAPTAARAFSRRWTSIGTLRIWTMAKEDMKKRYFHVVFMSKGFA